jgi:C1A family cysteine protease
VAMLPKAAPATFSCVALGWTLPVDDQGNCGSCWCVSTCGAISDAYAKAGVWPNDGTMHIAAQCVMDQCFARNGGCNGGDGIGDILQAIPNGLPVEKDYGPYTASAGTCKYTTQTLYPLASWGYCTPNQQQGIAATQDIKNTMVQYGSILTCVAADASWDSIGPDGVLAFVAPVPNGSTIDHEVRLVGWDDTKVIPGAPKAGAWLCQNQWSSSWGLNGLCWIAYTSHTIGFESSWQVAPSAPTPIPIPPVVSTYYAMSTSAAGVITFTPVIPAPSGVSTQQQLAVQAAIQACNAAAQALQAAFPPPTSKGR